MNLNQTEQGWQRSVPYSLLLFFFHRVKGSCLRDFGQTVQYCVMFWIERFKQHVYVKRKTRICTTWPSFASTCPLLFIISSSRILSIRIVFFCSFFYFEKFSTLIWRLPNMSGKSVTWKNSRLFATLPLVCRRNKIWETNVEISY